MLRSCSCPFWLVLAFLLLTQFRFCLAQSNATTTTIEDDDEEKVDENVIYIIVAIILVFFASITVVIIISLCQTKYPAMRVVRDTEDGVTEINTDQIQVNAAYELNSIPELDDLPTTWWEIEGDKLHIKGTVLGSGQFGIILLGEVIKDNGQRMKCAVKTLKPGASHTDIKSLMNELQNMSTMDAHPNIVNLIGAQTKLGGLYVVVEYCINGDLFNYVRKNRVDLSSDGRKECGTSIEYVTRLRITFDIANGMDYLTTKGFIHRDLATRNVLLDGEMRAKVSDFGRTRDISNSYEVFQSVRKNEPVPTRWMPVETLSHQIFSKKSDVWSFGVLLWEIESGGTRPYNEQQTYRQVVQKVVKDGYRLQQPYNCPDVIYEIMRECWKIDPEERPTFRQISENIGNLLAVHLRSSSPPAYTP